MYAIYRKTQIKEIQKILRPANNAYWCFLREINNHKPIKDQKLVRLTDMFITLDDAKAEMNRKNEHQKQILKYMQEDKNDSYKS